MDSLFAEFFWLVLPARGNCVNLMYQDYSCNKAQIPINDRRKVHNKFSEDQPSGLTLAKPLTKFF